METGLIPRFSCPIPFNFCRSPNTVSLRFMAPAIESTRRTLTVLPSIRAVPLNRVDVISEVLPFIKSFRDDIIVVKYGEAVMSSPQLCESFVEDVVLLSYLGLKIVLVHGGEPEIKSWLTRFGADPKFSDKVLYMEAVEMVFMKQVQELGWLINRVGAATLVLDAKNRDFLTARAVPYAAALGLGFVGELSSVNPDILQQKIQSQSNFIPVIAVIAPIAADHSGQTYHIHADTAAAEIAAAIGVQKLILLTDVAGILEDNNDPNSLIKEINVSGIEKMIEEEKLTGGMIPMVECCLKSLRQGVRTTRIVDGRIPHSLMLEMLTNEDVGTLIRKF